MAYPNYQEYIDDHSPSTAGFAVEGGKCVYRTLVDAAQVDDAIKDLLGTVKTNGNGGLKRTLPRAHPQFPWLYAARISNVQGLGYNANLPAIAPLESPTLESFAGYKQYLFTVEFEPPMYPVLPDEAITKGTLSWTDENGSLQGGVKYAVEDQRFTDFEILPQPQLITAQLGTMAFYTQSGASPGAAALAPGKNFPGFLQMTVPQCAVKVRWVRVPYTYITSPFSYLVGYIGRVNQVAWREYEPGTLLYLGCTAKRYVPVKPDMVLDPDTGRLTYTNEKICDLELNFLDTSRSGTDLPLAASVGNANWVAGGHNLMPNFPSREFYYAAGTTPGGTVASCPPTYLSVDFRLLFSDPDA